MLPFKNCIIFGATGTIGKGSAVFINNHCKFLENLIFTGRNEEKVEQLENLIGSLNSKDNKFKVKISGIVNDLSIHSQRVELRDQISTILGEKSPDLLIFSIGDHIRDTNDLGNPEKIIATNLIAPLSEAHWWIPSMINGSVIFFSDSMIHKPLKGYSAYYSAKAGVETAAKILALESAPNIRVNVIAPGIMNLKPTAKPDAKTRWENQIPMGKIGGIKPITDALYYLLRDEYLTGNVLKVDGGLHL